MTQQARKKLNERKLLLRFSEENPRLDISAIQDFESPDFICATVDGECGIELAEFVFHPKRANEALCIDSDRRRMQQELNGEHDRRGLPPMNVWVQLSRHDRFRDVRFRNELKEPLVNFVAESGTTGWPPLRIEAEHLSKFLYERGVSSLSVAGGPSCSRTLWSFPHTAWLPDSEPGMVQSVIDKKNLKLATYRCNISRNWLLISAGPLGLESMIEATDSVLNATYRTAFERVFLFRTFGSHTHELKIEST